MLAAPAMSGVMGRPAVSDQLAGPPRVPPWRAIVRVGEGATSVVWRAEHTDDGRVVALKIAGRDPRLGAAGTLEHEVGAAFGREAALLARVARRWGPALIDAGRDFLVTEWTEGTPVHVRDGGLDRARLAAIVAHGVGRALEELHDAGVRHGDVKPENVLRHGHEPTRDASEDRGATLIDLGLATDVDVAPIGGTPRYAAPELRERGEAGPAADLWALGMVLAEILDVRPGSEQGRADGTGAGASSAPARWVEALLAVAPGARPSASWLADSAARFLGLRPEAHEAERRRIERVRRTYPAARARDIAGSRGTAFRRGRRSRLSHRDVHRGPGPRLAAGGLRLGANARWRWSAGDHSADERPAPGALVGGAGGSGGRGMAARGRRAGRGRSRAGRRGPRARERARVVDVARPDGGRPAAARVERGRG